MFLGVCAQVTNLTGTKSRTSTSIAHHWLQCDFPERLQQSKYNDKKKARAALTMHARSKSSDKLAMSKRFLNC